MHWIRRHRTGRPPHPDVLTPAEWRVLEHVREGLPNAEIAVRLGVSINTVRTHVSSMLAKLDLPDRHALAQWHGQPSEVSRHHLERTPFALPFADWPSLLRIAAGGGAAVAGIAVLWFAIGMAQDGGTGDTSTSDLSGGSPPERTERLGAVVLTVGGDEATVSGVRTPTETRIDIALPAGLDLLAGPQLVHEGTAVVASSVERTAEGVSAAFPVTASGSDLHVDLGPAVRMDDGDRVVFTVAYEAARNDAGVSGPCPKALGDEFALEEVHRVREDASVAVQGSCGWNLGGLTGDQEWLGITVTGTWNPRYGLLRDGHWPDELRLRNVPGVQVPGMDDSGPGASEARAFDAGGEELTLNGHVINFTRDADGWLAPGESAFQFRVGDESDLSRVTLLIARDAVVIEGDHAVVLPPEQ